MRNRVFSVGDLSQGSHLFPFRTEKLSLVEPMILLMGKVGSRQHRVLDSKNSPYYKGYFALPFYVKRFLYIYFNIAMIQVIMFQFKKILKLGITVAVAVILTFSGSIFLSAYFANFTVSVQNIDTTLGPLESSDTEFVVSFDPLSPPDIGNESYHIAPFSLCNQNEYDNYGNCIDPVPNLCPYLSLQPKNEEATEIGFTQNPSGTQAIGQLNNPDDENDTWNLTVKSPCFEGECPADYDESQNGVPLSQSQKGQIFKCDLFVETNDIPVLVKNYLEKNI